MSKSGHEQIDFPVSAKTAKGRDRSTPAKDPVFPGHHEGEEVQFIFRQHPVILRRWLIVGLLVILLSVVPLDLPIVYQLSWLSSLFTKVALLTLVAVILFWVYKWMLWYYSCTIVTMERIVFIKQNGFFDQEVNSLFHGRIHGLDYNIKGIYATLLGFGDLLFLTEVGNFTSKFVPDVTTIHQQILGVIRDNRGSDDWSNENFEVM